MPGAPMGRDLPSRGNARRTTQQSSGADGKEQLFRREASANEPKHFHVVYQRLLTMAAGHEQDVKQSCVRNARIRRKLESLHIAHRRSLFRDDLDCCIRHAGKNFKGSREVNLIHPLENPWAALVFIVMLRVTEIWNHCDRSRLPIRVASLHQAHCRAGRDSAPRFPERLPGSIRPCRDWNPL